MAAEVEPLFLPGSRGRLFGLYVHGATPPREAFVFAPPFAEEMNRCRALVAEQARRFAGIGIASLLLDPFGTGDSDGDLEDASWETWREDLGLAADWLGARAGCPVSLWGLRLGALLAGSVFEAAPERYRRLLLWQPVTNGKQFMTQYLRLRVAWLMERDLPAETTEGIRAEIAAGAAVEVAGYRLAAALTSGIDGARFPDAGPELAGRRIDWLENAADTGAEPSIAAKRAIEALAKRGAEVRAATFAGAPLWQLHKRDVLPEVMDATAALIGESS